MFPPSNNATRTLVQRLLLSKKPIASLRKPLFQSYMNFFRVSITDEPDKDLLLTGFSASDWLKWCDE
jgi:hypothetical protein